MREVAMAPVRELMAKCSEHEMHSSIGEEGEQALLTDVGGMGADDSVAQQVRPLQLSDLLTAFGKVAPAGQDAEGS
jgi:hypothetical protein